MSDHVFLCMNATNQGEITVTALQTFDGIKEADQHVREWLIKSCGLDCQEKKEEVKLREENDGELPEMVFLCPEIGNPPDLEQYNGFHFYGSGGAISLFLTVLHDEKSAAKFRAELIKEFELDKIMSEEADEMIDMLDVLEQSFREHLDYEEAVGKVNELLRNGGLSFF